MAFYLIEAFIQIAIVLPLVFLFLKNYKQANLLRVLSFVFCFVVYQLVLVLPRLYIGMDFIQSSWNWDGKLLGIAWGIICFFAFRSLFKENNFFRIKQDKANFKEARLVAILLVVISTVVWYALGKSEFDLETLAFQISLPGLDEEILFRGVLLGLLMSALKGRGKWIAMPGLWIISILFGLVHGLQLKDNYSLSFDSLYFLQTGFAGYVWGWITIKSRSILLAIFSHNLSNFFGSLSMMLK